MQQHSDEALLAYLDDELDPAERRQVEAWLAADPAAQQRRDALAQSADLVRGAFAEMLDEPVPERLLAAAKGAGRDTPSPPQEAEILVLPPHAGARVRRPRRWQIGLAAAAGLCGIVVGGAGAYLGAGLLNPAPTLQRQAAVAAADNIWLDNAAGYYKLVVNAGDNMLIDVPASNDTGAALHKISQNLPQQARLPDLKPWGLTFRGARLIVVNGRPAAQLVYLTDNKAIGPLTLVISATTQPDVSLTLDHRDKVNLLYWRHRGRAYALVGQTDTGYLWGIANDIAWQLNAI
jgi:anti-sigma factor RsiW